MIKTLKTIRMKFIRLVTFVFFLPFASLIAQDETLEIEPVRNPFFSSRIVNSHSVQQPKTGELEFRISHRFGQIKGGAYELWGLDQATTHFSLEYNPIKIMTIGLGRSNYLKTFDGFVKLSILKQHTGSGFPLFISYLASSELHTINSEIPDFKYAHRFNYTHQLLVARKFGDVLSVQLMPTLVHKNLVEDPGMNNNVLALGFSGRVKVSNKVSLNWDTYWVDHGKLPDGVEYFMPLAMGVDIKTSDHVFQIILSNSMPMRESGFISETSGDISQGEIHLGFNISRMFYVH